MYLKVLDLWIKYTHYSRKWNLFVLTWTSIKEIKLFGKTLYTKTSDFFAQAQRPWLTGPAAPWHVGSSRSWARTRVPCIRRQTLNHCATREARSTIFIWKGKLWLFRLDFSLFGRYFLANEWSDHFKDSNWQYLLPLSFQVKITVSENLYLLLRAQQLPKT